MKIRLNPEISIHEFMAIDQMLRYAKDGIHEVEVSPNYFSANELAGISSLMSPKQDFLILEEVE
jgi:hypothetical protein